jgi:hypothetical protein
MDHDRQAPPAPSPSPPHLVKHLQVYSAPCVARSTGKHDRVVQEWVQARGKDVQRRKTFQQLGRGRHGIEQRVRRGKRLGAAARVCLETGS